MISTDLRKQAHKLAQELLALGFELTERSVAETDRARVLTVAWSWLDGRINLITDWRAPSTPLDQQASALLEALLKGCDLDTEFAAIEDRKAGGILRDVMRAVKVQLEADGNL